MSQHDFSIANQTASNARADINNALQALASNNSGNSAPSTTYANMWWYENDSNLLKIRNESDNAWIDVAYVDGSDWNIIDDTLVVNIFGTQIGRLGDQATSAWETGTGTEETLVSPAKVAASATEVVSDYALGVGQTWQNLTSSRAINTIYQNTTGRPIQVNISAYGASGNATFLQVSTASNMSNSIELDVMTDNNFRFGLNGLIPNNSYYRAQTVNGGVNIWNELR